MLDGELVNSVIKKLVLSWTTQNWKKKQWEKELRTSIFIIKNAQSLAWFIACLFSCWTCAPGGFKANIS